MRNLTAAALLAFAAVLPTHAAEKHSASVTLYAPVQVGDRQLAAGDYSLHWTDSQLTLSNAKVTVSMPISSKPGDATPTQVQTINSGDKQVLQSIHLKGTDLTVLPSEAKQ